MKKGTLNIIGLSLFCFSLILSPGLVLAEQTAEQSKQKEQNKPAEKPASDSEIPDVKQLDNDKWKEKLDKRQIYFVEWLEGNFPEKANELLMVFNKQPEHFIEQLDKIKEVYGPILREEKYHPELAAVMREDLKLQDRRDQLLREVGLAKDEDKPELLKQLKELVSARFDNLIQQKQLQYEHTIKRLEKVKQQLDERGKELEKLKTEKDESVEKRLKELMDQNEKIDWK